MIIYIRLKVKEYQKIKSDTSLKSSDHAEFKSDAWNFLTTYTFMQNLRFKGKKIMRVQNWRLGGNFAGYTFMQNLGLKVKNTIKSSLLLCEILG